MSSVLLRFFLQMAFILSLPLTSASAQSLLSKMHWQRLIENANQSFAEKGSRMAPKDPEPLSALSDSIRQVIHDLLNSFHEDSLTEPVGFVVSSWRLIAQTEADWERLGFHSLEWAFLGNTTLFRVDTLLTKDIRARLEFHFGPPTVTLVEEEVLPDSTNEDIIQFEYWFVINDSLPIVLIDVNGPWDRGVVMSVPSPYREILPDIKEAFLGQLASSDERMPFADYYFNSEQEQWYVTVFDGASFYDVRTEPPNLQLGRPRLGAYISTTDKRPE